MKKILLILLFVLPSVFVLADGPQYRFLKGNGSSRFSSMKQVYDVKVSTRAHASGFGVADYDNVNAIAKPAGRSLVSSEVSIDGEGKRSSSVSGHSAVGIGVSTSDKYISLDKGNLFSSSFVIENSGSDFVLGKNGSLAGRGTAVMDYTGRIGAGQPPLAANPVPLGDALLPMLLLILSFAGFVCFRKK